MIIFLKKKKKKLAYQRINFIRICIIFYSYKSQLHCSLQIADAGLHNFMKCPSSYYVSGFLYEKNDSIAIYIAFILQDFIWTQPCIFDLVEPV